MNENEFELAGMTFSSKVVPLQNGCKSCALFMTDAGKGCAANYYPDNRVPDCDPGFRKDGRNVIFVEERP